MGLGVSLILLSLVLAPARGQAQSAPLVQVATNAKFGQVLVNAQGMTLYWLSSEVGGKLVCTGGCLKFWLPVLVPSGATAPTTLPGVPAGLLGTITRPEGTQVTFNGFPLYAFVNDKAAGDTNGEGIHFPAGGIWYVATVGIPLAAAPAERLSVNITTTGGTVWGRVIVRYIFGGRLVGLSCVQASCSFIVPGGVKVHLRQLPTNTTTWPFREWLVRPSHRVVSKGSLTLTMKRSLTVRAIYALM
jgi:predicted lipoprotein with Yx(FWY)xxD motif